VIGFIPDRILATINMRTCDLRMFATFDTHVWLLLSKPVTIHEPLSELIFMCISPCLDVWIGILLELHLLRLTWRVHSVVIPVVISLSIQVVNSHLSEEMIKRVQSRLDVHWMAILETQAVLDRSSHYIRAQRTIALTRAARLHIAQHHVIQANRIYTDLGIPLPFFTRSW
jgi:hypothetical protein